MDGAPFQGKSTAHPRRKCIKFILESTTLCVGATGLSVSPSRSVSGEPSGMGLEATGAWGIGWYIASDGCCCSDMVVDGMGVSSTLGVRRSWTRSTGKRQAVSRPTSLRHDECGALHSGNARPRWSNSSHLGFLGHYRSPLDLAFKIPAFITTCLRW